MTMCCPQMEKVCDTAMLMFIVYTLQRKDVLNRIW